MSVKSSVCLRCGQWFSKHRQSFYSFLFLRLLRQRKATRQSATPGPSDLPLAEQSAAFTRSPLGRREVAMMDGSVGERRCGRPFSRVDIANLKRPRRRRGALSALRQRRRGWLMSQCGRSSPQVPRRRRGRDLSPLRNVAYTGTRGNTS